MRSRSAAFLWLLRKETRELLASPSWWLLFVAIGPLVGLTFSSAVRTYGEISGLNGTSGGVGEAMSPLVGVWGPTFSACEIAAVFLLPFVAIRQLAADRQSGALKIELQRHLPSALRMSAKALVLLAAWAAVLVAPILAMLLWRTYGGTIYLPEMAVVILGHLLNAGLAVALAVAAAAITDHPATAAIVTLGVTVGTWILSFVAAVQGGIWERAAAYTPTSMVGDFQHGLLQLAPLLVTLVLIVVGLAVAGIWTRLGIAVTRRGLETAIVVVLATGAIAGSTRVSAAWDLSEARLNSFPIEQEQFLRRQTFPFQIEVHLAPEDPRRVDYERNVLSKLRRVMPRLSVTYVSTTSTGLFEQARDDYGEIWYIVPARNKWMSRTVTAEGAFEAICGAVGEEPPEGETVYRGRPLSATPRYARLVYYAGWPAMVASLALIRWRRRS